MLLEKDFTKVPISIVSTTPPGNGIYQFYRNFSWAVTEDDCILLYKGKWPQCSVSRSIMENHAATLCPYKVKIRLLENVFLPHDCKDFI